MHVTNIFLSDGIYFIDETRVWIQMAHYVDSFTRHFGFCSLFDKTMKKNIQLLVSIFVAKYLFVSDLNNANNVGDAFPKHPDMEVQNHVYLSFQSIFCR